MVSRMSALLVRILQDQAPSSWMHYNSNGKHAVYFLVRILQDQAPASWMHYNSRVKLADSLNAEPSLSLFEFCQFRLLQRVYGLIL